MVVMFAGPGGCFCATGGRRAQAVNDGPLGRTTTTVGAAPGGCTDAAFDGGGPFIELVEGDGESDELTSEGAEFRMAIGVLGDDVLKFGDGEAHLGCVATPGGI